MHLFWKNYFWANFFLGNFLQERLGIFYKITQKENCPEVE